jgi:hypothetical protein
MNKPVQLDISDAQVFEDVPPLRKFLYLVLLVAVKDRSHKAIFEPLENECQIFYEVQGRFYDMVPAPFPGRRVTQAVRTILEMDHVGSLVACQCRLRVKVGDHVVAAAADFRPIEQGDRVVFQIFNPEPAAQAAADILKTYVENIEPEEPPNGEGS